MSQLHLNTFNGQVQLALHHVLRAHDLLAVPQHLAHLHAHRHHGHRHGLQVETHLRGGHVVQHWWAARRASPIQLSKQVLGGQVAAAQLHRPIRELARPARSSHWSRDQHCVLENGRRRQQLFYSGIKKAFDRPMVGEDFNLKQEKG